MQKIMLDTNTCIFIIREKPQQVLEKFKQYTPGEILISSIVFAELYFGVEKSTQIQKNKLALSQFTLPLEVVSFDAKAAEVYGKVRAGLQRKGTPIGPLDTLIAAHALSLGVPVITDNMKEFSRVEGLEVLNWVNE